MERAASSHRAQNRLKGDYFFKTGALLHNTLFENETKMQSRSGRFPFLGDFTFKKCFRQCCTRCGCETETGVMPTWIIFPDRPMFSHII